MKITRRPSVKAALNSMLLFGGVFALADFISSVPSVAAPVSFQQAVADYTAGKYNQAESELETYKRAYPTNAMVHYYLALCKQAMGHLESAKAEYLWVTQNGDARLKGMAQAGFDQLSKVRSSTSSAVATATPAAATAPGTTQIASAKVKKIIEFYADW